MLTNIHSSSDSLGTLVWNFSFIGDINLSADSDGNIYISNLGIESIFSQQLSSDEPSDSIESLNSWQLL